MKIIFLGTTGVHHSLVAANIYLERLQGSDFEMLEGYADLDKDNSGFPIYVAQDEQGNQVYTLGAGKNIGIGKKTIEELVAVLGYSSRDLLVKPISIKGDNILYFLGKIPRLMGGAYLNLFISNYILNKEISYIEKEIAEFKISISH
jgi:hypothetical protein